MMHSYQLFLKELQDTTFNKEVDRARERWMYEMYDCGQQRQNQEMIEYLTPKPKKEKLFNFHDYEESSKIGDKHFGVGTGQDGWNK